MHLVSKLLALAATSTLAAHAFETSIFTFPSNENQNRHTTSEHRTVSEDVAGLILELRVQSSLQSVLGRVEADIVDRINEFSGAQYSLFGGDGNHGTQRRSMILLESVNQAVGSIIREARPQSVVVSDVSSSLVDDFVGSQLDDGEMKKRCTYHQGDDIQVRLFCAG